MLPGATDGLPSREESERLLARGTVDASRIYEQHMLAALLRIEDRLAASAPAEPVKPPPKRRRTTKKAAK